MEIEIPHIQMNQYRKVMVHLLRVLLHMGMSFKEKKLSGLKI